METTIGRNTTEKSDLYFELLDSCNCSWQQICCDIVVIEFHHCHWKLDES